MTKLHLDKIAFTKKPEGFDIGKINSRITTCLVDISPEDLANEVTSGRTFVGATLKEVNGEILRRKDNWESQTVVALDFDEGLTIDEALNDDFFKKYASFMYLTFSHTSTKHKFRVVFILESVITYYPTFEKLINQLLVMYPQADQSCKDGIRLYFGGSSYTPFDFNNRLPLDCISSKKGFCEDIELLSYMSSQKPLTTVNTTSTTEKHTVTKNTKTYANIYFIRSNNSNALKSTLNVPSKVFSNYEDAIDYIKQFDLHKYLGLPIGNFHDIFHDEHNPSASIYMSHIGNGHYLYKCHSLNHNFSGSIIEVTKKLLNNEYDDAVKFIFQVLNVSIEYDAEAQYHRDILKRNLEVLDSDQIIKEFPYLARLIRKYGLTLGTLLTFAHDKINVYESKAITFPSLSTLAITANVAKNTVSIHLSLLTLLGLIIKYDSVNIPKSVLSKLLKYKQIKSNKYANNVYGIPAYDSILLQKAEVLSEKWIKNGCTNKTINYEGILKTFGKDVANTIFPQDKDKQIPPLNELVADYLEETLIRQIISYGYTTESFVLDETKLFFVGQKKFKEAELKRCISEIIEKYALVRVPLNKVLKEKLAYEGNGYPKVLLKEDLYNELIRTE